MKLPDFSHNKEFNDLREKMRAQYVRLASTDPEWERFIFQLEQEGIDLPITEVGIQGDGTFEYRGQRVIVYIRDQMAHVLEQGKGYKYHLVQCRTLEHMRSRQRYDRYVVTNRKDGNFVVNIMGKNKYGRTQQSLETTLDVCKNCTNELKLSPQGFDLRKYFASKTSSIDFVPKHSEYTAPLPGAKDWSFSSHTERAPKSLRQEPVLQRPLPPEDQAPPKRSVRPDYESIFITLFENALEDAVSSSDDGSPFVPVE